MQLFSRRTACSGIQRSFGTAHMQAIGFTYVGLQLKVPKSRPKLTGVPFSADIHVPGRKRKVDGSRLEANDLEICRRPDGARWLLGTGGFGQVTRLAATACLPGIVGGSDRHLHLVRT